jgi:hypothetical protein
MKRIVWIVALAAVAVAGCAGNPIVTGRGEAPLDAYPGKPRGQAVALAKRAALLLAQRDLLERYAGTVLESETQIKQFVAETDRILTRSQGLIKGARVRRTGLSPDQSVYIVEVEAPLRTLEKAVGTKPDFDTTTITWPGEVSGLPPPKTNTPDGNALPATGAIRATGTGIVDKTLDPRVARLRAERAAKMDAVRNLGERVNGIRLDASTTVKDFAAEQDVIRTRLHTVVRGARVVKTTVKDDGTVEVAVELSMSELRQALGKQ